MRDTTARVWQTTDHA